MKKSFSTGVTGLKERARRIAGSLKGDGKAKSSRRRRDIEVSAPVQQVSGTSAFQPESIQQLDESLRQCDFSAEYLRRLITTGRHELIPSVVTVILEHVQKMLDGIIRFERRNRVTFPHDEFGDSIHDSILEERQQEARHYLATLVKLSDSFVLLKTKQSGDDTKLAEEMIDSLLQVLKEIVFKARYILPYQSLNRRHRQSLHSSMDDLVSTSNSSDFDIAHRSSIRRSFRTLKKKITNSSSILRNTSVERTDTSTVKRRNSARSHSAIRVTSNANSEGHYATSRSTNSIDHDVSLVSSKYDQPDGVIHDALCRPHLDLKLPAWDRSRPSSAASYDVLSNCSSSHRVPLFEEPIFPYDDSFPPLPLKNGYHESSSSSPPTLPPKTTRPLGGLNVFTPSKERYSIISSDSRDSFLNDKFEFTELSENLPPPEIPEKQSPIKNSGQRDSGYNEVSSETVLIGTPEQIIDKVLSEKVKGDVVEAFLSSYRTFLTLEKLVDELLMRIRRADTCLNIRGLIPLQILLRIIDQIVQTELNTELFTKLSDEIFWMMTHRETDFMKYAKQLREHIMKKWDSKIEPVEYSEVTLVELKDLLRLQGQQFIDHPSELIAQQLTLIDADLYRRIEGSEFVISSMGDTFDRETVPNFALGVDHFNALSYWSQGIILTQNSSTKEAQDIREKIMWKFFHVLTYLRKIQNFNSYFALVAGISSHAVGRLSWKNAFRERIQEFQHLTDVEKNFSNYRPILKNAQLPCLPYIGLIKQDLYQVHFREKPLTEDGLVNFKKVKKLHRQLESIRRFRDSKYDFQQSPELSRFFGGFRCLQDDDELWNLSYSIKKECSEHLQSDF